MAAHSGRSEGVNLIAYTQAESGVGELGRILLGMLHAAAIPVSVFRCRAAPSRQAQGFKVRAKRLPFERNLVCAPAAELPKIMQSLRNTILAGMPTIGYWPWEVDVFPDDMAESSRLVTEIWTLSRHAAAAIAGAVSVPVHVIPPFVEPSAANPTSREDLGLPPGHLFLFCFDMFSVFERKNPLGVITAFKIAFPEPTDATLLIKCINGLHSPEGMAKLRAATKGRPDILLWGEYFAPRDQRALIATCDSYVSLHRAEGFGFTMAEAMSHGKVVIATGYSGNLEFMTPANSILVPYTLIPVGPRSNPYPPTALWADPDVSKAAAAMRTAVGDPDLSAQLGGRARADIATLHDRASRAALLRDRFTTEVSAFRPERTGLERLVQGELARYRLGPPPRPRQLASAALRRSRRLAALLRRSMAA